MNCTEVRWFAQSQSRQNQDSDLDLNGPKPTVFYPPRASRESTIESLESSVLPSKPTKRQKLPWRVSSQHQGLKYEMNEKVQKFQRLLLQLWLQGLEPGAEHEAFVIMDTDGQEVVEGQPESGLSTADTNPKTQRPELHAQAQWGLDGTGHSQHCSSPPWAHSSLLPRARGLADSCLTRHPTSVSNLGGLLFLRLIPHVP